MGHVHRPRLVLSLDPTTYTSPPASLGLVLVSKAVGSRLVQQISPGSAFTKAHVVLRARFDQLTLGDELEFVRAQLGSVNVSLFGGHVSAPTFEVETPMGGRHMVGTISTGTFYTLRLDFDLAVDSVQLSIDGGTPDTTQPAGIPATATSLGVALGTISSRSGGWHARVDDFVVAFE